MLMQSCPHLDAKLAAYMVLLLLTLIVIVVCDGCAGI